MSSDPTLSLLCFRKAEAPERFSQAASVRWTVFVEEQKVTPELEVDAYDDGAIHALILEGEEPVATARMFPQDDDPKTAIIGRVAVLEKMRGRGVGKRIMEALLAVAQEQGYHAVELGAQIQAQGFYESLGFVAYGETYVEENILHTHMRKPLVAEAASAARFS